MHMCHVYYSYAKSPDCNYALTELVHDPVTNYIHYLYAI